MCMHDELESHLLNIKYVYFHLSCMSRVLLTFKQTNKPTPFSVFKEISA